MMDLASPLQNMKMFLNHFTKLIKAEVKLNQVWDLGLSISSDIIRSHGGTIELRKSETGGLKVMISLPV